jgi:hypothetical protein
MLAMLTCFGRAAEPIKIGMVAPVTGPLAESGRYQIGSGANLKSWLCDVNGQR